MTGLIRRLRRAILPFVMFVLVVGAHYLLIGLFPERDPAQDRWVAVAGAKSSWLERYIRSQDYWMGLAYGMSGAFVAWAVRRWREHRRRVARNAVLGGLSLWGCLAVAGCFLTGCCGSPMLAVYVGLLGAWFLPLAKPLCAGVTAVSLLVGWWWVNRRMDRPNPAAPCGDPSCACDSSQEDRPA